MLPRSLTLPRVMRVLFSYANTVLSRTTGSCSDVLEDLLQKGNTRHRSDHNNKRHKTMKPLTSIVSERR